MDRREGGGVALIESRHRWKSINSAQGTRRQRGKFKVYEVKGHVVKINDQSVLQFQHVDKPLFGQFT